MAAAHGQIAVGLRMNANPTDLEAGRELIARTAILLDDEKFDAWVELFDAQGTYELSAYSTEIRRWMTWQFSDRETLQKMLADVDEHVRDPARRRHIVGIPYLEFDGDHGRVKTHFSLFRTSPEGQSSLYMVGCYDDRIVRRSGSWLYAAHKVIVDTRMLDGFTHIPV
jgi:3-phenylpropionate/cinnamic acid dioxygenase small subunit